MKKHLFTLSLFAFGISLHAQTPRLSLFEEFTGETCPPCAATNPDLNDTLALPANFAKMVAIKWQVPIPSAPTKTWSLYQTNKTEIDWRWRSTGYGYNPPINSAPSGKIDGQEPTFFGAASSHPANMNSSVISTAQSYTSPFSISMARAWNKTCTAVNLTITIQATAPYTASGPLIFRTVMVERLIQFSVQPGTNGETKFEDVAIKSFPTLQGGTAMAGSWIVGQSQTFTLSCTLPSYTRKKEEVAFVGFIQDDGDRKVIQAMRVGPATVPQEAISGIYAQVDLTCSSSISPTVEIKNENVTTAITALTLTPYIDGVAGTPIPWTGNLLPGASQVVTLGSMNSPGVSGSHTFSCDITMSVPVYNLIKNETSITYMVAANYQSAPVAEGFVSTAFPPAGFGVINNDGGPSWSRTGYSGGFNLSTESTKYDFYNNTVIGDKDELYLPPMDLSSAPSPQLSFDLAHAQRNATTNDALDVLVSDDCGVTWINVYHNEGVYLATTMTNNYAYTPDSGDPSHWRTDIVDLSAYNKPNMLVKFVTTSDHGNNLYLDNINLAHTAGVGLAKHSNTVLNVSLYPNPAQSIVKLQLSGRTIESAKVSVINTLGEVVFTKQINTTGNLYTMQIETQDFAVGIYSVRIDTNSGSTVKKLTISK
jgi:hypothetical protein